MLTLAGLVFHVLRLVMVGIDAILGVHFKFAFDFSIYAQANNDIDYWLPLVRLCFALLQIWEVCTFMAKSATKAMKHRSKASSVTSIV